MAVSFDIMICTGRVETSAAAMVELFSPSALLHPTYKFEVNGHWWASLTPKGFGYGVPADKKYFIESRTERLEILRSIYGELAKYEDYKLVQDGCEIEELLRFPDEAWHLTAFGQITTGTYPDSPGTIVHRELLDHLENPSAYVTFNATHVWIDDLTYLANLLPA